MSTFSHPGLVANSEHMATPLGDKVKAAMGEMGGGGRRLTPDTRGEVGSAGGMG